VQEAARYFSKVAQAEWAHAIQRLERSADKIDTEMAAGGKIRSGAHIKRVESAISDELCAYGNILRTKLTEFDHEHSPIRLEDFELAKQKVSEFRDHCLNFYNHRIQLRYSHYPNSRKIFDGGKLEQPLNDALLGIEGDMHQFKSRRSFFKWAIGDLRKRVWSASLLIFGTILGSLSKWVWDKML
jgi:hypothetical protein